MTTTTINWTKTQDGYASEDSLFVITRKGGRYDLAVRGEVAGKRMSLADAKTMAQGYVDAEAEPGETFVPAPAADRDSLPVIELPASREELVESIKVLAEGEGTVTEQPPATDDPKQAAVVELVRKYGTRDLRVWDGYKAALKEFNLQPSDVTDERLSAASLFLHQQDEQYQERLREINADPNNRLKVAVNGKIALREEELLPAPGAPEQPTAEKKTRKGKKAATETTEQPKATKADPAGKDRFGYRLGSQASAISLCLTDEPLTVAEIAGELKLTTSRVKGHLDHMVKNGQAVKTDQGYRLATE